MSHLSSQIKRVWLLYGLFFLIVACALALSITDVVGTDEPTILQQINSLARDSHPYAVGVTNLPCRSLDSLHTYPVHVAQPDLRATARVTRFDLAVASPSSAAVDSPLLVWANALQLFSIAALVAIFVIVLVLLVSFYKSIKSGRLFFHRGVKWIRVIGILMLLMSLGADLSIYLERSFAAQLLAATPWQPQHHFTIHFTRIFFAIIILFVAELVHVGYAMQQEQDLTV